MMAALQAEHASSSDTEGTNVTTLHQNMASPPFVPAAALPDEPEPATSGAPEALVPMPSREERFAVALDRAAQDEIAVVTVRVSASLNRYMDDYVNRVNRVDPKRKYRKQDAIADAFAAFYADHPMPPAPAEAGL
jgi:hypothetical protein